MYKHFIHVLLLVLAALEPGYARDFITSVDIGLYQSEGDYGGAKNTLVRYMPINLRAQKANLFFKLTTGWVYIDGPGNLDTQLSAQDNRREQGPADTFFTAGYLWNVSAIKLLDYVSIEPKIKIPTADETKSLGTGKLDYFLASSGYKSLGKLTLHGTFAYRWRTSPPNVQLYDTASIAVGGVYGPNDFYSPGVLIEMHQAASNLAGKRAELTPYLSINWNNKYKTMTYLQAGFASGSPKYAIGIQNTVRF